MYGTLGGRVHAYVLVGHVIDLVFFFMPACFHWLRVTPKNQMFQWALATASCNIHLLEDDDDAFIYRVHVVRDPFVCEEIRIFLREPCPNCPHRDSGEVGLWRLQNVPNGFIDFLSDRHANAWLSWVVLEV